MHVPYTTETRADLGNKPLSEFYEARTECRNLINEIRYEVSDFGLAVPDQPDGLPTAEHLEAIVVMRTMLTLVLQTHRASVADGPGVSPVDQGDLQPGC